MSLTINQLYVTKGNKIILICGELDLTNPAYALGYRFLDHELNLYKSDGRSNQIYRCYDLSTYSIGSNVPLENSLWARYLTAIDKKVRKNKFRIYAMRAYGALYVAGYAAGFGLTLYNKRINKR